MSENDKLPPTIVGALRQHVLRTHVTALTWSQLTTANQTFLDPTKHGYYLLAPVSFK